MAYPSDFVELAMRLKREDGAVISTGMLSQPAIDKARKEGRLFVDPDTSLGYAFISRADVELALQHACHNLEAPQVPLETTVWWSMTIMLTAIGIAGAMFVYWVLMALWPPEAI